MNHNKEFKADYIFLGQELISALAVGKNMLYRNTTPENLFVFEKNPERNDTKMFINTGGMGHQFDIIHKGNNICEVEVDIETYQYVQLMFDNLIHKILHYPNFKTYYNDSLGAYTQWMNNDYITYMNLPYIDTENVDLNMCIYMFSELEYVRFKELNLINYTHLATLFNSCPKLKRIDGVISNIAHSMVIDKSPLDYTTTKKLINALLKSEGYVYIHLSAYSYNLLSEEDIAIATERGWSVLSS